MFGGRLLERTETAPATGWGIAAVGCLVAATPVFALTVAGVALAAFGAALASAATTTSICAHAPAGLRSDALATQGVISWASSMVAGPALVAAVAIGASGPGVIIAAGCGLAAVLARPRQAVVIPSLAEAA